MSKQCLGALLLDSLQSIDQSQSRFIETWIQGKFWLSTISENSQLNIYLNIFNMFALVNNKLEFLLLYFGNEIRLY